jgi:hypothetical protein
MTHDGGEMTMKFDLVIAGGELSHFPYADPEGCAKTIKENPDLAIGVKLRFELKDSDGNIVTANRRLLSQTTINDGRIWYERPAGE